jgi:hypothetical protein
VVNAVKVNGPNWRRYGQLVADIQEVLLSRQSWQIRHVRRLANSAIHGLIKAKVKLVMNRVCINEILEGIRDIVILKKSALIL